LRAYEVGQEPTRDPLDQTTVDERVALMWPLAREAWAVAGQPIPSYDRSRTPGRIDRRPP
jgi:hypothetical protein